MLTPSQMTLYHPGWCLRKVLAVKVPRDLYTLVMSQVSYKKRTKASMIVPKTGILKLDFQDFQTTTREISQEKISIFKKKMHFAFLSKIYLSIHFLTMYCSSALTNVL
jgi:hypothetical protein